MAIEWRGAVASAELNALHAEAFATRVFGDDEWDWAALLARHSLGWVVAREEARLVGFTNVVWDGLVHAWLQDVMVAASHRGRGVGSTVVAAARDAAVSAGCEWLHVDFDADLVPFYLGACGFNTATAGTMALTRPAPPTSERPSS